MPLNVHTVTLAVSAVTLAALVGAMPGQGRFHAGSAPEAVSGAQRSPSGRISFSAGVHPHQDIYVVDADGSGLRRLTDDPGAEFDPSWSPDGTRIAFRHQSGDADSTAEIYVMDDDGSRQTNLTRNPAMDYAPAWSPDGSRIAFASDRAGEPAIWVMNADGSKPRPVSRVSGEYPAWSPDGRRIAFDRNTLGVTGWDIWVVNVDGSRRRPLIASTAEEQGAAWSPDGKTIAYGSSRGAPSNYKRVWLANAGGSNRRLLARRVGERPAWSKRGGYLLFTAGGIFVVRRDGSGLKRVALTAPGEVALADWTR